MQICQYLVNLPGNVEISFPLVFNILNKKKRRFIQKKSRPFRNGPSFLSLLSDEENPPVRLIPVDRSVTQFLLNAEQLVVLGDPVGTAQRTGFDLTRVGSHCNVCNGCIFGLT